MKKLPSLWQPKAFENSPFQAMNYLQKQMERYFGNFNEEFETDLTNFNQKFDFLPASQIEETDAHYLVSIDVPGVKKDDIKIEVKNNILTVSGERKEESEKKDKTSYRSECLYGSFSKSFNLENAVKADQVEAHYADGVLRLTLPKAAITQAQSIKIADGKPAVWNKQLKKEDTTTTNKKH